MTREFWERLWCRLFESGKLEDRRTKQQREIAAALAIQAVELERERTMLRIVQRSGTHKLLNG